jgi:asparagine synthase (glutamine-hydrolysing)
MKNRGPDRQNWKSFQKGSTHIYIPHSRLSIIDLDLRANQPLSYRDNSLVFNGEIDMYIGIRKALQRQGYEFVISSDTEAL